MLGGINVERHCLAGLHGVLDDVEFPKVCGKVVM